jgi:hypothetical protein
MTATDALSWVMRQAVVLSHPKKPGAVIEHTPPEYRESLHHLASADISQIRPDEIRKVVTPPGFCIHGHFYTERCTRCGR